jgi:uncharacterized protein YggE
VLMIALLLTAAFTLSPAQSLAPTVFPDGVQSHGIQVNGFGEVTTQATRSVLAFHVAPIQYRFLWMSWQQPLDPSSLVLTSDELERDGLHAHDVVVQDDFGGRYVINVTVDHPADARLTELSALLSEQVGKRASIQFHEVQNVVAKCAPLETQARMLALADAAGRAHTIAAEEHLTLGSVLEIRDDGVPNYGRRYTCLDERNGNVQGQMGNAMMDTEVDVTDSVAALYAFR